MIGEDVDNFFDEEEEEELDGIELSTEHVKNFWNSTINWANVDLSFPREGEGKRQLRRKRKFNREKEKSMPKNALIQHLVPLEGGRVHVDRDVEDDIFDAVNDDSVDNDYWASKENMEICIKELNASAAKIHKNSDLEQKQVKETSRFEYFLQAICILRFLQKRLQGLTALRSAAVVVEIMYGNGTFLGSYKSRCMIRWAIHYLKTKQICKSKQGKHIKTHSIILDEVIQTQLREHLRSVRKELRTPENFMNSLNNELLRTFENAPDRICEQTARRWMFYLGFRPKKHKKGFYVDGHERIDVVAYREGFLQVMVDIERRTGYWDGDNMENYHPPELQDGEVRVIPIVHDESIFHSNEAQAVLWEEDGIGGIRAKSKGPSQHISGFSCPCHGFPALDGAKSYKIINPGKNNDGYWTNDDLVLQVQEVIPLFEALHPDCELLFMFDNSQNHHKKSPDGLCVNVLNLSDGGKNTPKLRNGWFIVNGQRQDFQMQNEYGVQKGLKTILQERNRWAPELKLECKDHLTADAAAEVRGDAPSTNCCARRRVAHEPDFLAQREWLREVVEDKGHRVMYFPKFH